jgi:SpoIID/LytB domain protein
VTSRRFAGTARALAILTVASVMAPVTAAWQAAPPRRVGWQVIDLASGRVLDAQDAELLSRPVLPGSLMKVPALVALLESGAITSSTRIDCPGGVVVDGRRIGCEHARRAHALSAVEALALSCNVFFARASERLPRSVFDGVLESFGWPAVPASLAMAAAASGIEGTPVQPGRLLAGWRQLLIDPPGVPLRSPSRKLVTDALGAVAHDGTASVFAARDVDALAKTSTSVTPDKRSLGLVLAAWPGARPRRAALVIVEGGVGADAASIAVALARGERPAVGPPPAVDTARLKSGPTDIARLKSGPIPSPVPDPSAMRERPLTPEVGAAMIRVGMPQPGGTYAVRSLGLEDYVARVLAGEAAPRTGASALEALAITVRTFALANRRRHAREGFDLCDSTHCQVLREAYAATRAASDATAGQVLAWQGTPASVFYTASCGGRTERPSAVWRGAADPPYLPSRRDRGCGGEPKWVSEISVADLQRALAAAGYHGGRLRKLKVRERAGSGRVAELTLDGLMPDRISGQDFRMAIGRTLGWQVVKSTAFDLAHHRDTYTLKGHGYGHGVGFCVIGSMRRAAGGESRASLLKTYFPGLQVADYRTLHLPAAPVAPPGETLTEPMTVNR